MPTFDVVHITPDLAEAVIFSTDRPDYAKFVANSPDYPGAWLSDSRKLLRSRKGEIQIRITKEPEEAPVIQPPPPEPKVTHSEIMPLGKRLILSLTIAYHEELKYVWVNAYTINGFDINKRPLWQANNFTTLADFVGKELAYQCLRHYEDYLKHLGLKGAM